MNGVTRRYAQEAGTSWRKWTDPDDVFSGLDTERLIRRLRGRPAPIEEVSGQTFFARIRDRVRFEFGRKT